MADVIDLSNIKPEKKQPEPEFTCKTCASVHTVDSTRKECRRFPPTVHVIMQQHQMDPSQVVPAFMTVFPGVSDSMHCDEWNEEVEE